MKKKIVSLTAICLSVLMALTALTPAFAEETASGTAEQTVKITVAKANKKQYFKNTGHTWSHYPVNYPEELQKSSTLKTVKVTEEFPEGKCYDIKWDKKHKTTSIKFTLDKLYTGQKVTIKDSCRHSTWSDSHADKVFTKTVTPTSKKITYKFNKEKLKYENHVITVTAAVPSDTGMKTAGELVFHVHVRDKGEQIIDTGAKYLGRVVYSNTYRNSIEKTAPRLSYLNTHTPKKSRADCSSYVSYIYYLHGLWSGSLKLSNRTACMGPNSPRRPKSMKRNVARSYKNMGCVWMVGNGESGHKYAHAALMVGDNYYLNVTAHSTDEFHLKDNACFQKCTRGSRNYAVADVYKYRSW